ncbi:DUF3887 domain-containing protein [Aquimarina sp. MMG015]|uniref:DUF3887 domain-containing protein n=1 Tax=Aquimarina TaxID=290174 RepID=UPI00048039A1|nr:MULTISPECIES: DUF3887 domain-containing protein [Aquimarina]AXT54810.1 DUF3887 domain-containing protein [Aquimarina sp. AD1]MBQ4804778.1 DUF3887 domain-containing protein [Aquimarina sp. MMG015]
MKYILLLLVCIASQPLLAQDTATYEKTTKAFQENFNAQNIDAVFDLYSAEMQEEMTKEGVTRFIKGCHSQFGNLNTLTFIESAEGINSYTAAFDNISLVMELKLNSDGKIATIQFQEP